MPPMRVSYASSALAHEVSVARTAMTPQSRVCYVLLALLRRIKSASRKHRLCRIQRGAAGYINYI